MGAAAGSPAAMTAPSAASQPGGEVTEIGQLRLQMGRAGRRFADGKTALLRLRGRQGGASCSTSAARALKTLDHPSTVTGLAFDAKGKRIAASHYNGCLALVRGRQGGHARACSSGRAAIPASRMHPGGEAVVTAMQENALHGWRLADGQHMRMSGYPSKTESLSFSRNGKWLASVGRGKRRAVAVLRRRADGQGADGAGGRRRRAVHAGSRSSRSRSWWRPGSRTGWW